MLREEGHVDENRRQPEMQLAQGFVVHATGPLRDPVIDGSDDREHRARHQHVVEVRHHEISVVIQEVHRRQRQHQAREAPDGEQKHECDGEQHRGLEGHRASPHRRHPVEHLHAGRHGDQHGREHEEQLGSQRHAHGEHVVRPDDEAEEGNRRRGIHHRVVAKQPLAGKRRDDGADDAEGRQNHDVHLGMPEEPENVLEHHRVTTARGGEETGGKVLVGQQHGHRAGQHGHDRDQQVGGDQPGPDEQRHFQQRHAGRTHVENGHDDVDGAGDRRDPHQVDRKDQKGKRITGLQHQRRVHGPATGGRAAGQEQR